MEVKKIHNKGQAKLFNNRHLEFFTKTDPVIIWAIYLPIIIGMISIDIIYGKLEKLDIIFAFAAGILFWTFFEYMIHRFVFH